MQGEIEVFEFLKNKNSIKGIEISDLQELLKDARKNKSYKNYTIKMLNQNSILLFDSYNSSNILLKCVKDYYKTNNPCHKIRKELGADDSDVPNCSLCYTKYIEKINNGEI